MLKKQAGQGLLILVMAAFWSGSALAAAPLFPFEDPTLSCGDTGMPAAQ